MAYNITIPLELEPQMACQLQAQAREWALSTEAYIHYLLTEHLKPINLVQIPPSVFPVEKTNIRFDVGRGTTRFMQADFDLLVKNWPVNPHVSIVTLEELAELCRSLDIGPAMFTEEHPIPNLGYYAKFKSALSTAKRQGMKSGGWRIHCRPASTKVGRLPGYFLIPVR